MKGYGCCQRGVVDERRVEVRLVFKRAELLYDIGNVCFVEGDILPEGAEDARHQVLDVVEAGNVDRVTRVLGRCFAEVVEALHPYSRNAVAEGAVLDDRLSAPEEYVLALRVPEGMSGTTVGLVEELAHEYLVASVVADWLGITHPEKMGLWAEKAAEVRARLGRCLMSRRGAMRRRLKPWG